MAAGVPLRPPTRQPIFSSSLAPGIRTNAVGPLPPESLLVETWSGSSASLWLVDLRGGRSPIEVANWDTMPTIWQRPDGLFSASRDGRTLVVAAPTGRRQSALYLVRPESGTSEPLHEDSFAHAIAPRLSPDGLRFAFTRIPIVSAGREDDGVWVGNVGESSLRRLAAPAEGNVRTFAAGWSSDGRWLAVLREADRPQIEIVRSDGGESRSVGDGRWVDWRAAGPQLLVVSSSRLWAGPSHVHTYELPSGGRRLVHGPADGFVTSPRWHPRFDSILSLEPLDARFNATGLWIRSADGRSPARVRPAGVEDFESVYDAWWSEDGARIYAVLGSAAQVRVVEAFSGRLIATIPLR